MFHLDLVEKWKITFKVKKCYTKPVTKEKQSEIRDIFYINH